MLKLLNFLDFIVLMIHNLQSIMSRAYTHIIDLKKGQSGFSLVELLIIIVIIGILTAIGTTVFAQMNSRAYDASIQNDLSNIAKKIKLYHAEYGVYPMTAQLSGLGLKVNKSAYGSPFDTGSTTYNLLYCRMPATAPTQFGLVAYSRSGTAYMYTNGGELTKYTGAKTGSVAMCAGAGITMSGATNERDWFFDSGSWQSYIAG